MSQPIDLPLTRSSDHKSQQTILSEIPSVVDESLVRKFKYWHQTIQSGMFYNNELYTHLKTYGLYQRLEAYQSACVYAEKAVATCLTVSSHEYSVWLNLRHLRKLDE